MSVKISKTVLVIDADLAVRRLIARHLRLDGFQSIEAHTAAEGVALAWIRRPDLVICDLSADEPEGYTALEIFRSQSSLATVPLILMTGAADEWSLRMGVKMGADEFLAKPFSGQQLRELVALQMRKHELAQADAERRRAELSAQSTLSLADEIRFLRFAELFPKGALKQRRQCRRTWPIRVRNWRGRG